MKQFLFLLVLLVVSTFSIGCDVFDDSPTQPTSIFTDGRVTSPFPGAISCEDSSSTIPDRKIARVQWTVRAPAGNTADSGTTAAGGEITFTGLFPGDYTVEQVAFLKDGTEGPPRVHGPVAVE